MYPVHLFPTIFDHLVAGERMPPLAPSREVHRWNGEFHPRL